MTSPARLAGFTGQRPLETYSFAESLSAIEKDEFDNSDVQLRFVDSDNELDASETEKLIVDIVPQELVERKHAKLNMESLMQAPEEQYEHMTLSQSLDAVNSLE